MKETICIGQVAKPRGLKGEIKFLLFDDGYLSDNISIVFIDDKEYKVEHLKFLGNCGFIKLVGVDNIEQAEEFRQKQIFAEKEVVILPKDRFFVGDILGSDVFCDSEKVGKLIDVLKYGGADVYVVEANGLKVSFPAIKKLIKSIDIETKKIVLDQKTFDEVAVFDNKDS